MAQERSTGTARVKRGLAEMLRGGVIMDVVDAEQAKIAEDAGAVAVMALERVPADIRRDGGVARMSDPEMIQALTKKEMSENAREHERLELRPIQHHLDHRGTAAVAAVLALRAAATAHPSHGLEVVERRVLDALEHFLRHGDRLLAVVAHALE